MTQHTQQARAAAALAAAATQLATAERAARNINRLRGNSPQPPRNPVNLAELITALLYIHDCLGRLAKTVDHYAQAVRWPHAGYVGAFGEHMDYPKPVTDAAATTEQALTDLARKLRSVPVGWSTDAVAGLDIAIADWRTKQRTATGNA